jgi:YHS domain-containing protein
MSPTQPIKPAAPAPRRNDAVAAKAERIPNELPMQADWNASLEPEAMGDNRLRSASLEQRVGEGFNPLRCALGGYCPVLLQEQEEWIAGSPDYPMAYQGQVFHFSSDAARKRFEASPEKYAPVQEGNDVVLAADDNRTVPGNVNHSAVWHGRLYLFSDTATLAKFQHDPRRYAEHSGQASLLSPTDSL